MWHSSPSIDTSSRTMTPPLRSSPLPAWTTIAMRAHRSSLAYGSRGGRRSSPASASRAPTHSPSATATVLLACAASAELHLGWSMEKRRVELASVVGARAPPPWEICQGSVERHHGCPPWPLLVGHLAQARCSCREW
jgi:hypothetical protein